MVASKAPPAASAPQRSRPRGLVIPLERLSKRALGSVEDDLLVDALGVYVAVVRLVGSESGIVEEHQMAARLEALSDYIGRFRDAVMRLSFSYPQPLATYCDPLSAFIQDQQAEHPDRAALLSTLREAMETLAPQVGARLHADYWMLTYAPPGSGKKGARRGAPRQTPARGLGAAFQRMQQAAHERARLELNKRCEFVLAALAAASLPAERVTGRELADLVEAAWGSPFQEILYTDPEDEFLDEGVQVTRSWARTSCGYVRSWYLRDFGEVLAPEVIPSLTHKEGVRVLQFWKQLPPNEARRILKFNRTIQSSEQHLRRRRDVADFDSMKQAQMTDRVRANLAFQQEQIYRYQAIIQQWAPTPEELEARSEGLMLELETQGYLQVAQATYQQDKTLLSALPLARCGLSDPVRNLDAATLSRLAWPGARDPLGSQGVWLGQALPSHLLLTMDLFALQNPVIELIGVMGSGKSMTQKFLLTQLVAQGYPAFVVDGAREYAATVEALGGTVLRLGRPDGPIFNPVHFDPADADQEGDPFIVGQSLLLNWLDAVLDTPLDAIEQVVAGRAYVRALATAGIIHEDPATWTTSVPLLADFCAALQEESGDTALGQVEQTSARMLALKLSPFTHGLYAPLFNRPEEVHISGAQVVCFDLYDVPDRLRLSFFQQVLAFIQRQTLRRYRYKGSVIVLDEAHLLLEDNRSARSLEYLVRNGRKAKQLVLFTQHSYTDSQLNRSAQLAHKTAGATLVFRINPQDAGTLHDLQLSPLEQHVVCRSSAAAGQLSAGECLLITPGGRWHLQVLIPPEWYPLFTTKPDEVLQLQNKAAEQRALATRQAEPVKEEGAEEEEEEEEEEAPAPMQPPAETGPGPRVWEAIVVESTPAAPEQWIPARADPNAWEIEAGAAEWEFVDGTGQVAPEWLAPVPSAAEDWQVEGEPEDWGAIVIDADQVAPEWLAPAKEGMADRRAEEDTENWQAVGGANQIASEWLTPAEIRARSRESAAEAEDWEDEAEGWEAGVVGASQVAPEWLAPAEAQCAEEKNHQTVILPTESMAVLQVVWSQQRKKPKPRRRGGSAALPERRSRGAALADQ